MKLAERIVVVLLFFVLVAGGAWIYFAVQYEHQQVTDAVARGEYEIRPEPADQLRPTDWQEVYPNTVPGRIGSTSVDVSVADTMTERIQGLSDTPFIPDHVVKLFVFGAPGSHSIWMKDMNYPIDILWLDEDGLVVHIEESIAPDTYPETFASPVPAWFVVETNANFVARNNISVGDAFAIVE